MSRFLGLSVSLLAVLCLGPSCVRYRAISTSPTAALRAVPDAPVGALRFDDAVRLLIDRHPELTALRLEAAAVNPDPTTVPLSADVQVRDGTVGDIGVGAEMLSLLGIGPRPAARWWARAVRRVQHLRHHERARALVGELAEAFAVHTVLVNAPRPNAGPDVAPYVEAGLISDAVKQAAAAVARQAEAEQTQWQVTLERTKQQIASLTGARAQATPEPVAVLDTWPSAPEASARGLLLTRGDLLRLWGEFSVADRAYRLAVAKQLPDVTLRLGEHIDLETPFQVLSIKLPFNAHRTAYAASQARHASAARVRAGVHAALAEAAVSSTDHRATLAQLDGIRAQLQAADALVQAEHARVETDPIAVSAWVQAHERRVQSVRALRQALEAEARARVRAARAAGWPAPTGGAR